jgi:hypothetical protein
MRSAFILLSLAIVILVACLVHQMRARRAAEDMLRQVAATRSAAAVSAVDPSRASGDSFAALDSLLEENRRLRAKVDLQKSGSVAASDAKIDSLKDVLARLPEQSIPELQFATAGDWYSAVDGPLETTEDYRLALGKLRASAEKRFAGMAQPALQAYLNANRSVFPKDVSQLMQYFDRPIDPSVLQRYKVVPASEVRNVGVGGAWAITQQSLIDPTYDSRSVIGPDGYGAFSTRSW